MLKFIDNLIHLGITKLEIENTCIIPTITKWLDYNPVKLINAKKTLIYDKSNSGTYSLKPDFMRSGISQSFIVKAYSDPSIDKSDYKYFYPYKTIGDLSQIQECAHDSLTEGKKDFVHIFLTFDRICAYISCLFNRTIIEESDSDNNILFNLKTFLYQSNSMIMELFNSKYRHILSGEHENFDTIDDDVLNNYHNEKLKELQDYNESKQQEVGQFILEALGMPSQPLLSNINTP